MNTQLPTSTGSNFLNGLQNSAKGKKLSNKSLNQSGKSLESIANITKVAGNSVKEEVYFENFLFEAKSKDGNSKLLGGIAISNKLSELNSIEINDLSNVKSQPNIIELNNFKELGKHKNELLDASIIHHGGEANNISDSKAINSNIDEIIIKATDFDSPKTVNDNLSLTVDKSMTNTNFNQLISLTEFATVKQEFNTSNKNILIPRNDAKKLLNIGVTEQNASKIVDEVSNNNINALNSAHEYITVGKIQSKLVDEISDGESNLTNDFTTENKTQVLDNKRVNNVQNIAKESAEISKPNELNSEKLNENIATLSAVQNQTNNVAAETIFAKIPANNNHNNDVQEADFSPKKAVNIHQMPNNRQQNVVENKILANEKNIFEDKKNVSNVKNIAPEITAEAERKYVKLNGENDFEIQFEVKNSAQKFDSNELNFVKNEVVNSNFISAPKINIRETKNAENIAKSTANLIEKPVFEVNFHNENLTVEKDFTVENKNSKIVVPAKANYEKIDLNSTNESSLKQILSNVSSIDEKINVIQDYINSPDNLLNKSLEIPRNEKLYDAFVANENILIYENVATEENFGNSYKNIGIFSKNEQPNLSKTVNFAPEKNLENLKLENSENLNISIEKNDFVDEKSFENVTVNPKNDFSKITNFEIEKNVNIETEKNHTVTNLKAENIEFTSISQDFQENLMENSTNLIENFEIEKKLENLKKGNSENLNISIEKNDFIDEKSFENVSVNTKNDFSKITNFETEKNVNSEIAKNYTVTNLETENTEFTSISPDFPKKLAEDSTNFPENFVIEKKSENLEIGSIEKLNIPIEKNDFVDEKSFENVTVNPKNDFSKITNFEIEKNVNIETEKNHTVTKNEIKTQKESENKQKFEQFSSDFSYSEETINVDFTNRNVSEKSENVFVKNKTILNEFAKNEPLKQNNFNANTNNFSAQIPVNSVFDNKIENKITQNKSDKNSKENAEENYNFVAKNSPELSNNINQNANFEQQKNDENRNAQNLNQKVEDYYPKNQNSNENTNQINNFNSQNSVNNNSTVRNNSRSEVHINQTFTNVKLIEIPKVVSEFGSKIGLQNSGIARIMLSPKNLGTLFVEINMNGETPTISFKAESDETVAAIEKNIDSLKEMLAQTGMKETDFRIEKFQNESLNSKENLNKDSNSKDNSKENFERENSFDKNYNEQQNQRHKQEEQKTRKEYFNNFRTNFQDEQIVDGADEILNYRNSNYRNSKINSNSMIEEYV